MMLSVHARVRGSKFGNRGEKSFARSKDKLRSKFKVDNFVKSPSAALRFILSHCGVRQVRLIPSDSRALHLELFTLLSIFDFLRLHQGSKFKGS